MEAISGLGLPALEFSAWAVFLAGAAIAGLATGVAGFGTGIVAMGLWLHVLPTAAVPPLVLLVSLGAQLATIWLVDFGSVSGAAKTASLPRRWLSPLVLGGAAGIPFGVWCLTMASPDTLRLAVACLLIAYGFWQLVGSAGNGRKASRGSRSELLAGIGGGALGGFAGLPGPVPLIYLQLRGDPRHEQRTAFLPYSLATIATGCVAMALSGHLDRSSLILLALSLPPMLAGVWLGARVYAQVSERLFRKLISALLLASGVLLLIRQISAHL